MVKTNMKYGFVGVILIVLLSGCLSSTQEEETQATVSKKIESPSDWKDIELVDISTGKTFKISDFKGKPVLLESFAVWCPTCKRQQDEIKKLHEEDASIVSVSLDTDPNEDEKKVVEHAKKYGYDWHFVVSPVSLTRELIDEFGTQVVNAPSAPVILICEDQSARLLKRGVKSVDTLRQEIQKGC